MIIFGLEGVLADCEHRMHFIENPMNSCENCFCSVKIGHVEEDYFCTWCKKYPAKWKLDYKSFYESCDKDKPIKPITNIWNDQRF